MTPDTEEVPSDADLYRAEMEARVELLRARTRRADAEADRELATARMLDAQTAALIDG